MANRFVAAGMEISTTHFVLGTAELLQRDLNTFFKKPLHFIPPLVQKMLPALAPEIFSRDGGALWQDGCDASLPMLTSDVAWRPTTEDALSFIDFLLKPVLQGFFSKLR